MEALFSALFSSDKRMASKIDPQSAGDAVAGPEVRKSIVLLATVPRLTPLRRGYTACSSATPVPSRGLTTSAVKSLLGATLASGIALTPFYGGQPLKGAIPHGSLTQS